MLRYIVTTEAGGLSFREGGVPPEGAEIVDEATFRQRLSDARLTPGSDLVPASVSSAQAKIQLRRAGLRAKVDALVAEADGETQDWYAEARTWQRANPHVVAIGSAIDLSPDQIDGLFRAAALIEA